MANIALQSALVDPSTEGNNVNSLINTLNSSLGGLVNTGTNISSATDASTSETTLQTFSLPANTLTGNGQAVRITAFGTTAANGNNKTMKLYFGTSVVSSGTQTISNKNWWLELIVIRTGAATQMVNGNGLFDTTSVTPYFNAGTDDLTTALTIKLTGTDGTASAGDIVCKAMLVELIK